MFTISAAISDWLARVSRTALAPIYISAALLAATSPAWGAEFEVTTDADSGPGSLRQAIIELNAAGAGNHSISVDDSINGLSLTDNLPQIDGTGMTVVINGFGATLDGGDEHRLIFVVGGDVTVENFNLVNGLAEGGQGGNGSGGAGGGLGAGGALFVNDGANVTLKNVNFDGNAAQGGNGGSAVAANGGGGGGGFGGDGGNGSNGGAGGGGLFGNGSSASNGGGGGGGITGNGGAASNGGGGGGGILSGGNAANAGGDGSSGASGGAMGATSFTSAPAGDGGDGQSPLLGGGGGGGMGGLNFVDGVGGDGGNGGDGGVGGGGGGGGLRGSGGFSGTESGGAGGDGGLFGGGGGGGLGNFDSSENPTGGNAGDFGGGGGGGLAGFGLGDGGNGGFGGGGGGSSTTDASGGIGGFGAGDGGNDNKGGDGGSGYGGAVFVRQGGTLTIINSAVTNNSVAEGTGGAGSTAGTDGTTAGAGMYVHTGVTANVEVTDTNSVTYADQISGAGGLQKTGTGTLVLSGTNNYFGATAANAGQLIVNGSVTSTVTSDNSGIVGGTGTIGNLINNHRVAPGNSIGTLNVTNNYEQSTSGTIAVEMNDGGNVAGTNNDLLDVNGSAELAGAVAVYAAAGSYTGGSEYTFITATTITGEFDTITDDLAFFTAQLGYTSTTAYFTLIADSTDFASIGTTPNQVAVGTYLDDNSSGATGSFQALLDELQMMSDSQVQAALEQMSGDIYGTTQQLGVQNTTLILHTIAQQLQPQSYRNGANYDGWAQDDTVSELSESKIVQVSYQPDGSMQFNRSSAHSRTTWAVGYGLGGHADSDGNAGSLDYGMGGAIVGFDTYWNANHRIGLYGGYVGTSLQTTNASGTNDINGGQIGAYIAGRNGVHYYTIISGFQFDGYDSERSITAGGLNLMAQGDYDGWQGFSYLERGFILHETNRFSTQPFAALQYVHVRQNGFTETGAGTANLSVEGLDDDSLRSLVGVRTQVRTVPSRAKITPEFRAVWVHEFLDVNSPVVATFAPVGGSSFIAEGLNLGRDWALVGTGLNYNLGRDWSAQANYDAQVNENQAFHVGSGSVQKSW